MSKIVAMLLASMFVVGTASAQTPAAPTTAAPASKAAPTTAAPAKVEAKKDAVKPAVPADATKK